MPEIINTGFPGTAKPPTLVSDNRFGGTDAVAAGVITLTATATTDSAAIIRGGTPTLMNDGDFQTFEVISADAFRLALCVRTAAGDATFLPAILVNGSNQYYAAYYRVSSGGGGILATGPTIAAAPFVRFRRSGTTSMIVETAATYGGSYTPLHTFDQSDGLWTAVWTGVQPEAAAIGGAGTVVLSSLGDGSDLVLTADALRIVAGTVPDPILAGIAYTIEVEAIDTTEDNLRVTSYNDPEITLGVSVSPPSGYEISSGDVTQPMVDGLATFPGIIFTESSLPPTLPPVIMSTRKVVFTTSPSVAHSSGVLINTAIIGQITDQLGVVETSYVTPVNLVIRSGNGSVFGLAQVTPVAGVFTFPLNTVGVILQDNTAFAQITLGILGIQGQSAAFNVAGPALSAALTIVESTVPEGAAIATVQIVGTPTGGTILLQGTANGVDWGLIDANAFVGGTAVNTFSAAFFGRATVTGLQSVRLQKSALGVAVTSATLNVVEA